ncbi:MAG: protein-methionine-sulfoxide reductase catalytic subunit MsrP [Pseudomonadota bacterium]
MTRRRLDAHRPSTITAESVYFDRRRLLRAAGLAAGGLAASACGADDVAAVKSASAPPPSSGDGKFAQLKQSPFSTSQAPNSFEDITTYNNYYEFGTGKADPARNARNFQPLPWSVRVSGECEKPGTYTYEDIVGPHAFEERVYRLRCVEAWAMVVPWVGIPMADLLKRFMPTSKARYVVFQTLLDRDRMPGLRRPVLNWPYTEGLTIAEAMNPLTLMATGIYGKPLLPQNGAPLRLVVPWKYGFKSIKGIVDIAFSEKRPVTSWEEAAPSEYGFYANVNPEVDHPRWSQARHREIGAGLFDDKVPTEMFNGYGEHVADLYRDLDLRRNF